MSCNVAGKKCRVCPGIWVAAALLFASLFLNGFIQTPEKSLPAEEPQAIEQLKGATH